jgi:hypothetical protein
VARGAKGLPHLGTCLPILPAFQCLPPYSDSIGRLYTADSTFPACPHRPCGAPSDVSTHSSRPPHPLAGSRPHRGYYSRHRGTRPADRLDITITTDQGRQFESQLFQSLAKPCGIQLSRTTAHHPVANGLVERFHLTLKAAIVCHADQNWIEALPLVGPQSQSGRRGEEKILDPAGTRNPTPQSSSPQVVSIPTSLSRYP